MERISGVVLLCVMFFCSCEKSKHKEPFVIRKYYDSGQVKHVLHFDANEKSHGVDTFWFDNGVVNSIHNYNHGVEHGPRIMSRPDGSLSLVVMYENNNKNGDFFIWRRNGRLISKTFYRDNLLVPPPFNRCNSIDSSVLKCLIGIGFNDIEALNILRTPYDSTEFGVPIR